MCTKVIFLLFCTVLGSSLAVEDDARVIKGSDANPGQFPWMVAVRRNEIFLCGGALIGPSWVLTSAECVWQSATDKFTVYVGGVSILNVPEPGRIEINVMNVYPHPKFDIEKSLYYYNIGLMKLVRDAPIGGSIQTISYPPEGTVYPQDYLATFSGWGGTNTDVSAALEYAHMFIIDSQHCAPTIGDGNIITSGHVCTAGFPNAAICSYDHGGPLVGFTESKTAFIIGINIYAGCLEPQRPTIFMNPSYAEHNQWIVSMTNINPSGPS